MATPARRIAAEVLMRVAQGGAFANLALDSALRQAGILEPREAALVEQLGGEGGEVVHRISLGYWSRSGSTASRPSDGNLKIARVIPAEA